jgi:Cft2 family RNA processing exonuclease
MEVLFVGGAQEVGASCLALELAGSWMLVDAGVRLGGSADPLPDLALLQDKPLRAIFVTHAHADHIGALPLVHQAFPAVPIYASRATKLLMEVMLSDALRIMEQRAAEEMELPFYTPRLVESMLERLRPLPIDSPVTLPELPGITIQATRAGHIAGALSLGFEGPTGSMVISGDISVTEQRTVLPAQQPRIPHPDLLVLESTYGTRLHANRQAEEVRFVQAVAEGIGRGGHVLIPAFGLGRGQEVLLILQAAMQKQQIPPFPIYVDGLIRRVCETYTLLPEALPPRLARQIHKGYLPFRTPQVHFVRDKRERERILAEEPACIVSSSGMLTGGPSAWYAARLAEKAEASILITGYQDEEAPGKRLLALAEQQAETIELDGKLVKVACTVAKYSLSAHADGGELAAYAMQLHPRQVALVHGDEEARAALRVRLGGITPVVLPRNGMTLHIAEARGTTHPAQHPASLPSFPIGIGSGCPFQEEHVVQLFQVVSSLPELRIVSARELALIWYGEATRETTQTILTVLAEEATRRYFLPYDTIAEAFLIPSSPKEGKLAKEGKKGSTTQGVDQQAIFQILERHLGHPPDLYRRSINPATGDLTLAFHFPAVAQERYAVALANAAAESQVTITLTKRPHHEMLAKMAQAQLPPEVTLRRAPAIHLDRQTVKLECMGTMDEETVLAARQRFRTETGWQLVLSGPEIAALGSKPSFLPFPEQEGASSLPVTSQEEHIPSTDPLPMSEALAYVQERFAVCPGYVRTLVNVGTQTFSPRFHFPEVARVRYAALAQEVEQQTGWTLRFAPQVHQEALVRLAEHVLPPGEVKAAKASLYHDRHELAISCRGEMTREAKQAAQERFTLETGWQLTFVGD